jgi:hypothetical protein
MQKVVVSAVFVLFTVCLFVTLSGFAKVQERTKRTISNIQFYRDEVTCPVQYFTPRIKGKEAKFGSNFTPGREERNRPDAPESQFEADDDFWEHLSVGIVNVSDKTVVYVNTYVYLYSADAVASGNLDAAMMIHFGNAQAEPPYKEALKPGESKILTLHQSQLDYARNKLRNLRAPTVKVGIFAETVQYDDGSYWMYSGRVYRPERKEKQSNLKNSVIKEREISVGAQKKSSCVAPTQSSLVTGFNFFSINPASLSVLRQ